ncbi:MAG TPA: DMT family transporter [Lutibacter sp.]|nr:DMT family transporter [Lutibacter sp.]
MSKLKNKNLIYLFMIGLAATLWGLDGVVLTPRLSNINVVLVVFLLHALPFLVMNTFLFKRYKDLKKLDKKALYSLAFVSVFGGAVGTISIVYALFIVNFQELSVVVLLQKFQPVFAILLASIFLGEKLSANFVKWSIVAIIAGYFLTFGWNLPNLHTDAVTLKAALLSLLASFSFGSSTVFGKRLLEKIDFLSATFFRYGLTFLLLLPVVVFLGKHTEIQNITSLNWMIFVVIALTSGSVAVFIYYYGLQHVKASNATLLELFFPISAILFDYFINNNSLSSLQWVSAAVMIFAIIRAGLNAKLKEK